MSRFEDRLTLLTPAPASETLRTRLAQAAPRRRTWTRTVPMAAAAAGLIAAICFTLLKAPPGQPARPNEAEKEFRRIEETLRGASALRVSYKRVAELLLPRPQKVEDEGLLLLKKGSRLNFTTTETFGVGKPNPTAVTFIYLCDGAAGVTRVKSPQGVKSVQNVAVHPKDLNEKFVLSLARDSIAVASTMLHLDLAQLQGHLEVSELASRTDETGGRFLSYKVKGFDAKLWFDPVRMLPLKRVLTHPEMGTFTETYEGWELNPDLSEDLFRLPE